MSDNTPYRVADYIADFLWRQGIEHVFLLPGGGAMYLDDGLGRQGKLVPVACLHEQAASIAAEAYGRVHPCGIGAAVVTTGPGATNAITAAAGAWIESVPLLIISGQVKRPDMLKGAPLRQKGVQEVDIISMVRPVTKYAVTVAEPEDIRRELECALYHAREGRAGPVWLDVPLDVQGAPIDPATLQGFTPPQEEHPAGLDETVRQVLELLAGAERPVLLAGHGVRLSGAAAMFRTVAERLGVPVVMTWNAMDLLPYEHPLCVGRPGVVALRAPNFAVQNADLLISVGSRLDNIITAYNPRGFARGAKKIVVDVDANEIEKLDMDITIGLVADAREFLEALLRHAPEGEGRWEAWRNRCQDWKRRYGAPEVTDRGDGGIDHYSFVAALSDALPENTVVSTGSSGLAVEVFYTVFRNKPGQRVFLTSGLGAMGYGLPAAIGACFASGAKPMVAVESDGSLQLNIQELATMHAFNLPICLVIMNNAGYCSIRNTQRNYFNGRYVGTGPEAGLFLPDLEKVAATYGLGYMKIEGRDRLEADLKAGLELPRPCILDVRLAAEETLQPKVAAIPQPNGSFLSMPLEDMSPLLPLEALRSEMQIELLDASVKARG